MTLLTIPRITGVRDSARALIEGSGLPADCSGESIVVDATQTLAATPTFADEIVRIMLLERHARELLVRGASTQFFAWIMESACFYAVSNQVGVQGDLSASNGHHPAGREVDSA